MRILVYGGTSGIGRACVDHFLRGGNSVWVSNSDVRLWPELDKEFWDLDPDAIVYSAGVNELSWIKDLDQDTAADILNVNLMGFFRVMRLVAHPNSGVRSVVAIGSDAAERAMRTSMVYCASKAGLHAAVRSAARELAPRVRVNCVAPGMTEGTKMTAYIDKTVPELRGWSVEYASEYENSQIPMGRRAGRGEIAQVVHDVLLGPAYMTGSIINVNGGR